MPPKSKLAGAIAPVQVKWQLTVVGGNLRTPAIIHTVEAEMEGQDKPVLLTPVTKATKWLSDMVTGAYITQKPLSRTTILETLASKLTSSDEEVDGEDKLEESPVEEEEDLRDVMNMALTTSGAGPAPTPKKRRTSKKKRANIAAVDTIMQLDLPDVPSTGVEKPSTGVEKAPQKSEGSSAGLKAVLMMQKGQLHIEVSALPWLVQYLMAEYATGGVAPVKRDADEGSPSKKPKIWWEFDSATWRASWYDEAGAQHRKAISVARRRLQDKALLDVPYATAKDLLYQELRVLVENSSCSSIPIRD